MTEQQVQPCGDHATSVQEREEGIKEEESMISQSADNLETVKPLSDAGGEAARVAPDEAIDDSQLSDDDDDEQEQEQSEAFLPPGMSLLEQEEEDALSTVGTADIEVASSLVVSSDNGGGGNIRSDINKRPSLAMRKDQGLAALLLHGGGGGGEKRSETDASWSSSTNNTDTKRKRARTWCCGRLFFNPRYSLRMQMMLSFGTVTVVAILFVIAICIVVAITAGYHVKQINQENLDQLFRGIEGTTARYLAESLTPRLIHTDVANILHEAVQDRFMGYPFSRGDEQVPFPDILSGTNKYPIVAKPAPLDWQITPNVNETNYQEHVQQRWDWYQMEPSLSTADAGYLMQGACDPSVTDPTHYLYWPNCTDANNDLTTGGVVAPTPTNQEVHRKASDLAPLLKALYEYHSDIRDIGIYFANGGSGSSIYFPHRAINSSVQYTSAGCDWLNSFNPRKATMEPIGTQLEPVCRPRGELVSSRLYNPLERGWCRDQALNPDQYHVIGPFPVASHPDMIALGGGRSVYDRITNELIACIYIGSSASSIDEILQEARATPSSDATVVRWHSHGTVVSSTTSAGKAPSGTIATIDELDIGVTEDVYSYLFELVDFSSEWDPKQVRAKYESCTTKSGSFYVSAYPIPPIPEEYDASYRPEFLVISSTAETADVFQAVDHVNSQVNDHVLRVIYASLIVGFTGFVLAALIILLMSKALTAPLTYMNSIANDIVMNIGKADKEERIDSSGLKRTCFWAPRTELDDVVQEFNKMVLSFSGSSITKPMKGQLTETANDFSMQETFRALYRSREAADFAYSVSGVNGLSPSTANDGLGFLNFGSNRVTQTGGRKVPVRSSSEYKRSNSRRRRFDSPLFFWTIITIATPLLLTTIAIAALVMTAIVEEFDSSIDTSQAAFVNAKLHAAAVYANLRGLLAASDLQRPTRDLHVLTRYSSWLLFGGLDRSESYVEMTAGTDECKTYSSLMDCPYMQEGLSCGCPWENNATCPSDPLELRLQQRLSLSGQSLDAWPNGDINSTSYPAVAFFANNTGWYTDQEDVPGSEKGESAAGYETTYDRLRSASAVPIMTTLYNHDADQEYVLSNMLAFEADGLFVAHADCMAINGANSRWYSSERNGASELRPEICPLGKYGYDPRCREWYDTGRKQFVANHSAALHVTSPYMFAEGWYAQSVTAPLFDPKTGGHVGQALIDFVSDTLSTFLSPEVTALADGGFPVLITVEPDRLGTETVVGPGYQGGQSVASISELVMKFDHNCTEDMCIARVSEFDRIVASMKEGARTRASFARRTGDGNVEEIYLSFAPVFVKSIMPVDSSDFSRGVEVAEYLVYSLGLAETPVGLLKPFDAIRAELQREVWISIGILALVIVLSTVLVVYISNVVTLSITSTVIFLLELIRSINRLGAGEEPPAVDRTVGCREIVSVANAMDALYRLLRCANATYFAGDLESAYTVLRDGLRLFKRLDNKKAVAIANNNLGNIMLAFYRALDANGEQSIAGMSRSDIMLKGTGFYSEAIRLGEAAYEEFYEKTGWSPECLDFMQHLSDRYFNRAMFLLTVKDQHDNPSEVEELGFRDLQIAYDMDVEIVTEGEQGGWNRQNRSNKLFNVALSRASGHISLQQMGYPDNWEVSDVLNDAFSIWKSSNPSSELFAEIGAVGRLQQIETELMKFFKLQKKFRLAAQIGIRMMIEDEYLLATAQTEALGVLLAFLAAESNSMDGQAQVINQIDSYLTALEDALRGYQQQQLMSLEELDAELLSTLRNSNGKRTDSTQRPSLRISINQSIRGDVTMEMF